MIQLKKINFKSGAFHWINKPKKFTLTKDKLIIETEPETDFWQRTYYGFSKVNGPAYLTKITGDFTFKVKTAFNTPYRYDQCGVILFLDNENWVKISVEYENRKFARLGSVVTNLGFSDWASTDISARTDQMWYRLNIMGQDVLIEFSKSGKIFHQMRVSHIHKQLSEVLIGVYACSPLKSSFIAAFSDLWIGSNSATGNNVI